MFELDNQPTSDFPYQLRKLIGAGSMGLVYYAHEPELNRKVAIKFLDPQALDKHEPDIVTEMEQRFLQEAQAAAALSHPGVVTIYRIGKHNDTPYIAMEWLDGTSLETMLANGPVPVGEVVRLGSELLDALHVAHQAGVIHRDIKPSNLIVLKDGRLKVVDFGIAHLHESELVKTQAGIVIGTPMYASPEQILGVQVDGRSDLYSVALVMYVLLTGSHPFSGQSMMALLHSIVQTEPAPVRSFSPAVPPALASVIHRGLRKDREDRYGSAAEMAGELAVSLMGEVTAHHLELEETKIRSRQELMARDGAPDTPLPSMTGLPGESLQLVAAVISHWSRQPIGAGEVAGLLRRLTEKPLHADPFSGAVQIGDAYLMLYQGSLVAAFDPGTGASGESVVETLPKYAEAVLFPVPEELPARTVQLLCLAFAPGRPLHQDLDSAFVNLPALSKELAGQQLDGVIRLRREDDQALILLDQGKAVLQLFSGSWADAPLQRRWESWISAVKVRASVEAVEPKVLFPTYRIRLEGWPLELAPNREWQDASGATRSSSVLRKMLRSSSGTVVTRFDIKPDATVISTQALEQGALSYQSDPIFRYLRWMTGELPPYLSERKRAPRWKYLVEWLPLIRKAVLHHHLPRPAAHETDFFDMVTFSSKDKVLHIVHRVAHGSLSALNQFVSRVIAAKTARIKTGDVGAACLIAPSFTEEAVAAYTAGKDSSGEGAWEMTISESITGYEGFVRLGPRRGFHLLLVREDGETFAPLLPDAV
jgi:serine/threonine protein kinase